MRCKGKVVNRACTVCDQTFGNDIDGEHLEYVSQQWCDEHPKERVSIIRHPCPYQMEICEDETDYCFCCSECELNCRDEV